MAGVVLSTGLTSRGVISVLGSSVHDYSIQEAASGTTLAAGKRSRVFLSSRTGHEEVSRSVPFEALSEDHHFRTGRVCVYLTFR